MTMSSVTTSGKGEGAKSANTAHEDKSKGCREEARHAIAKTLVTTNPNLLTEAQTMG